ncbi:hypothetical protein Trydic_g15550 [Trypoxylus dichotomus]
MQAEEKDERIAIVITCRESEQLLEVPKVPPSPGGEASSAPFKPHSIELIKSEYPICHEDLKPFFQEESRPCTLEEDSILDKKCKEDAVNYWNSGKKKQLSAESVQRRFRKEKLSVAYFPEIGGGLVGGEVTDPAPGTSLPVLTAAPCSGRRRCSNRTRPPPNVPPLIDVNHGSF